MIGRSLLIVLCLALFELPAAAQVAPLHLGQEGCGEDLALSSVERLAGIELHRSVRFEDAEASLHLRCLPGRIQLVVDEDVRDIPTDGLSAQVLSRIVALAIVESLRAREDGMAAESVSPSSPAEEDGAESPAQGTPQNPQAVEGQGEGRQGTPPPVNSFAPTPMSLGAVPVGMVRALFGSRMVLGGGGLEVGFRTRRLVLGLSASVLRGRTQLSSGYVQSTWAGGSFYAGVATTLYPLETSVELGVSADAVHLRGVADDESRTNATSGWGGSIALQLQAALRWPLWSHGLFSFRGGVEWIVRPVAAGEGAAALELGRLGVFARAGLGWRR